MAKKSSLGSVMRKRLSDITNSQQRPMSPIQDEKPIPVSSMAKDQIDKLLKVFPYGSFSFFLSNFCSLSFVCFL